MNETKDFAKYCGIVTLVFIIVFIGVIGGLFLLRFLFEFLKSYF